MLDALDGRGWVSLQDLGVAVGVGWRLLIDEVGRLERDGHIDLRKVVERGERRAGVWYPGVSRRGQCTQVKRRADMQGLQQAMNAMILAARTLELGGHQD